MTLPFFGKQIFIVRFALLIGFGAFGAPQANSEEDPIKVAPTKPTKLSWFKKDNDGVLWFQQGSDGQTKYSASLVLSALQDTIVVAVTANEEHMNDALTLAQKIRGVLQKSEHTPDKILIVAWKDNLPGIGYRFYTDGMAVDHDSLGKKGVFKPSEAKRKEVLRETMMQYKLLTAEYVPKGEWGKDHQKMVALKIVEP